MMNSFLVLFLEANCLVLNSLFLDEKLLGFGGATLLMTLDPESSSENELKIEVLLSSPFPDKCCFTIFS